MSAAAFDEPETDEWVMLSAAAPGAAAAPTPKAVAQAKAKADADALTAVNADLSAAQRELATLRAELAQTRGALVVAEQRQRTAEHELTRVQALSTQQRHTITHLSNQLALHNAAAADPNVSVSIAAAAAAAADDSSAAATAAAATGSTTGGADGHAGPRAAELRALRRAAKSAKHQSKGAACKAAVPLVLTTKQPVRAS